nr:hypothetical protein [Pseudomonas sp. BIGb0427]
MSRINFARKTAALGLALAACVLPATAFADAAELSQKLYNEVGEYKYDETPARLAKIQALLDQGADPKGQPMFLAASYKIVAPFELFLPKIGDVNTPIQENGETLLLFVLNQAEQSKASEADLRMVKGLIKAGADVNVLAQGDSATPLNTAAGKGSAELIKLLLASGADAKAVRPNGFTPLTGPGASNLEVIKLLVAAGANPYQVTLTGTTPLHHVCERAFEMNGQPDPQAAERIALLLKKRQLDRCLPRAARHLPGRYAAGRSRPHGQPGLRRRADQGRLQPQGPGVPGELPGQVPAGQAANRPGVRAVGR